VQYKDILIVSVPRRKILRLSNMFASILVGSPAILTDGYPGFPPPIQENAEIGPISMPYPASTKS
jgi:hypothetical protein